MTINNALYESTGTTVSTTEFSLINGSTSIATNTTDAVLSIWIDFNAMVAGDEYQIVLREAVAGGGTQRTRILGNVIGVQPGPWTRHGYQVGNSWDVTLQRLAGADRSIAWSLRAIT